MRLGRLRNFRDVRNVWYAHVLGESEELGDVVALLAVCVRFHVVGVEDSLLLFLLLLLLLVLFSCCRGPGVVAWLRIPLSLDQREPSPSRPFWPLIVTRP
jgi:hypothetical protein